MGGEVVAVSHAQNVQNLKCEPKFEIVYNKET